VLVLVLVFMAFLIIVNIRKRNESQTSILLRILTNYVQLVSTAMTFNLNFPSSLSDSFSPIQRVGSTQESFMSFDCFVEDAQIRVFAPSTTIFKLFLTAILPLVLIAGVAFVLLILHLINSKWFGEYKRNLVVATVCIMFLLHPTLAMSSLSLFQCTQIDSNMKRVTIDMTLECHSTDHLFWSLTIGLPMIVVWVIGCPLLVLVFLIQNRNHLEDNKAKLYFLTLYQGLKANAFYWEFVNTIRKIMLMVTNVVLSTYNSLYRIFVSVCILLAINRLQTNIKPFKNEHNNQLEILSILVGAATLF